MTYDRPLILDLPPLPANTGLAGEMTLEVVSADGETVRVAESGSGIVEVEPYSYRAVRPFSTTWQWVVAVWRAPGFTRQKDINASDYLPGFSGAGSGNGGVPPDQCSFDPSLPTDKDWIRNRIGDTNGQPRWWLSDATILAMLAGGDTRAEVAAQGLESIAAQCNQLAMATEQADLKRDYGDRSSRAMKLAMQIRSVTKPPTGTPATLAGDMVSPDVKDLTDFIA